jgi:hypothetical protein
MPKKERLHNEERMAAELRKVVTEWLREAGENLRHQDDHAAISFTLSYGWGDNDEKLGSISVERSTDSLEEIV